MTALAHATEQRPPLNPPDSKKVAECCPARIPRNGEIRVVLCLPYGAPKPVSPFEGDPREASDKGRISETEGRSVRDGDLHLLAPHGDEVGHVGILP